MCGHIIISGADRLLPTSSANSEWKQSSAVSGGGQQLKLARTAAETVAAAATASQTPAGRLTTLVLLLPLLLPLLEPLLLSPSPFSLCYLCHRSPRASKQPAHLPAAASAPGKLESHQQRAEAILGRRRRRQAARCPTIAGVAFQPTLPLPSVCDYSRPKEVATTSSVPCHPH